MVDGAAALVKAPDSLPLAPGRRGLSSFKNLLEAWADPLGMLSTAFQRYGDVFGLRFGWIDYVVVNEPEGVHRVLVENHKNYVKSRNYQGLKTLLGQGLLTSEGEFWRQQRKLIQPAFHRERLAGFAADMTRLTAAMLDRWEAERAPGEVFDLHEEMMRVTFRIVGQTLFSADLDGDARAVGEALNVALHWANDFAESVVRVPPWVPTPKNLRFRRAQRVIEGLVLRLIAERRARGALGDDLLGLLMGVKDEATGEGMSERQLMDEMLTLVLAGHETTANALSFTLYLLSLHPEVSRRLEAEVEAVLSGRTPALADLPRLVYTRMVIEESMRLFPPAWIIEREALAQDAVAGFRVERRAIVALCPYLLHRHPRYWPNPEGFDPERFAPGADASRPRHTYFPFGGGPRTCIGNNFALMEMQLMLPMIVQRTRPCLAPGFRLELDPSITLRPTHGIAMRAQPRGRGAAS